MLRSWASESGDEVAVGGVEEIFALACEVEEFFGF